MLRCFPEFLGEKTKDLVHIFHQIKYLRTVLEEEVVGLPSTKYVASIGEPYDPVGHGIILEKFANLC